MNREDWIKKIVDIFIENQKDLEGYSYYGSAWGVSEDDYEDVAGFILDSIFKQATMADKVINSIENCLACQPIANPNELIESAMAMISDHKKKR
jgi:hypothetical protein